MTIDDRILLAEAIGWRPQPINRPHRATHWVDPDGRLRTGFPFDPFTSADDDYAVLEFMRGGRWQKVISDWPAWACEYVIGDYARAYLSLIDEAALVIRDR